MAEAETTRTGNYWYIAIGFLFGFLFTLPIHDDLREFHVQPRVQNSTIKFSDLKGLGQAKYELQDLVNFLKDPREFAVFGAKIPKGVFLEGARGSGKTTLARAVAGEAGVPIFSYRASDDRMGAIMVQKNFDAAKAMKPSPCIIFIDDVTIDAKMTLHELLIELDDLDHTDQRIIVIAAAANNWPGSLDEALTKRGRFELHIVLPNPEKDVRKEILESHMLSIPMAPEVDLTVIAKATLGFSGGDLVDMVNNAALKATMDGSDVVSMNDLEDAKLDIMWRNQQVLSENASKRVAFHESGHALVAMYTEKAPVIHLATILPRGKLNGFVQFTEVYSNETGDMSLRKMLLFMDVTMGGRAAEEIIYGEGGVGLVALEDLQQVTILATDMVTKYGMSSQIGLVSHNCNERMCTERTRVLIEDEVKRFLNTAYNNAKTILTKRKDELVALANHLSEYETLTGFQIDHLLHRIT